MRQCPASKSQSTLAEFCKPTAVFSRRKLRRQLLVLPVSSYVTLKIEQFVESIGLRLAEFVA